MVTESGSPAAAPEVANVVHFSDFAFDFPTTIEAGASGPPPFASDVVIDVEALSPGQTVYLPLAFDVGNWVAVCFVQDLDDPAVTHLMEGMIQEFSVT